MEKIQNIFDGMKMEIEIINTSITEANEKKLTYNRSKEIRKAAQAIKVLAQELRKVTTEEFKALKNK